MNWKEASRMRAIGTNRAEFPSGSHAGCDSKSPRQRFIDDWIPGPQLLIDVRQTNRSAGWVRLGRNQGVFYYYENLRSVWSAPGQPWRKGRDPIQRDGSEGRRRSMLRAASKANAGQFEECANQGEWN